LKNYLAFGAFILFFVPGRILCQNINIPNSSFETWDNLQGLIDVPDSWPSSDLVWFSKGYSTRNVYSDSHCHSGKCAAHIGPDTAEKKIWPGFIAAKFAAHVRVKYFSLYYVDSMNTAESGVVQISLFKGKTVAGDSIGGAVWNFPDSIIPGFTYEEIPLTYSGTDTTLIPDSISVSIEIFSSATALPSGHVAVDDVGLSVHKKAAVSTPVSPIDFNVFPNPSSGIVRVVSSGYITDKSQMIVSDVNGKIIYNRCLYNQLPPVFDFSDYPSGIYLLNLISGDNKAVNRIIISH